MRIPRVFLDLDLPDSGIITLPEPASHYLCKVLRMTCGRALTLFNGLGKEYSATLVSDAKKSAQVDIHEARLVNRESPLHTHLAIGISRGDRMDLVIQKATELGVSEITPLFLERSEVKLQGERLSKKHLHWQQIAISACEQCQRNRLPTLNPATQLPAFCDANQAELKLLLHHRSPKQWANLPPPNAVSLLIGPEGGLSDQEIQLAQQHGFITVALGPRVLRTETAPLTALTAVQLRWGDLLG